MDLTYNITKDLQKGLQDSSRAAKSFDDALHASSKDFERVSKHSHDVSGAIQESVQTTNKFKKALDVLQNSFKKLINIVKDLAGGLLAAFSVGKIIETIKLTFRLNDALRHLSARSAIARETLTEAMQAVTRETGLAIDEAQRLIHTLAEGHVAADALEQLAVTAARFTKITGVSQETAASLMKTLSVGGKMSVDQIQEAAVQMSRMQRAIGLSVGEMTNLSNTVEKTTILLNQMGKTNVEIARFNTGVTQLVGAFVSVGLKAESALEIVEDLLDPGKVQQNMLLYSKLGITMEEAYSGNVNWENTVYQMKALGQEMRSMSGPAAAAMAQQLHMPLATLRQLADVDLQQLQHALQTTGGDMDAALASLQGDQEGAASKWENLVNRFQGLVVQFATPLENVATTILRTLEKIDVGAVIDRVQIFFNKAVEFIRSLPDSIKALLPLLIGGLVSIIALVSNRMRKSFSEATSAGFTTGAENSIGAVKSSVSQAINTAMTETMAGNANRQSAIRSRTPRTPGGLQSAKSINSNLREQFQLRIENYRMQQNEAELNTETSRQLMQQYRNQATVMDNQATELRNQHQSQLAIAEVVSTQKLMNNAISIESQRANIERAKANEARNNALREEHRMLNLMSTDDLRMRRDSLTASLANLTSVRNTLNLKLTNNDAERTALRDQRNALQANVTLLQTSGALTSSQVIQLRTEEQLLQDLNREIAERDNNETRINAELQQQNAEYREQEASLQRITNNAQLNRRAERGASDPSQRNNTLLGRTGRFFDAQMRSIRGGFTKLISNVEDRFSRTTRLERRLKRDETRFQRRDNRETAIQQRKEQRIAARQQRGFFGNLSMIGGPIMMIAGMLTRLEPVQEAMKEAGEQIMSLLNEVGSAFGLLIKNFMPLVTSLVRTLLPPLLKVLGWVTQGLGWFITGIGTFLSRFNEGIGSSLVSVGESIRQ